MLTAYQKITQSIKCRRNISISILLFEEKLLYELTRQEETQAIKQQDSRSRNKNGYFGIFQLQLKLRRLCNHGTLFKKHSPISQNDTEFDPEQALGLLQEKNDSRCHYCDVEIVGLDPSVSCRGRFTTCGHLSTSEDTRILIMTTGTGRSQPYNLQLCVYSRAAVEPNS